MGARLLAAASCLLGLLAAERALAQAELEPVPGGTRIRIRGSGASGSDQAAAEAERRESREAARAAGDAAEEVAGDGADGATVARNPADAAQQEAASEAARAAEAAERSTQADEAPTIEGDSGVGAEPPAEPAIEGNAGPEPEVAPAEPAIEGDTGAAILPLPPAGTQAPAAGADAEAEPAAEADQPEAAQVDETELVDDEISVAEAPEEAPPLPIDQPLEGEPARAASLTPLQRRQQALEEQAREQAQELDETIGAVNQLNLNQQVLDQRTTDLDADLGAIENRGAGLEENRVDRIAAYLEATTRAVDIADFLATGNTSGADAALVQLETELGMLAEEAWSWAGEFEAQQAEAAQQSVADARASLGQSDLFNARIFLGRALGSIAGARSAAEINAQPLFRE